MATLEEKIFSSTSSLTSHVVYWHRYVDDTLCLWNGPVQLVHQFLDYINSICPTIKFTVEIGGETINFLDLGITISNNKHSFDIFRKPTSTDCFISDTSFHTPAHKHAAFLSMVYR